MSVLAAGLDLKGLVFEAPMLRREGIEAVETARGALDRLVSNGFRLLIVGPRLPDLPLLELLRRIRSSPATRAVSILALIPANEPRALDGGALKAGANAVIRRPLDRDRLECWIARLMSVPRRVRARIPVEGQVVGTHKASGSLHFVGVTRNLSIHGVLLASPVRLVDTPDLDLELSLPGLARPLEVLGRVVREAPEVAWPYMGYGVEFLCVPPDSEAAIAELVARESPPEPAAAQRIHSTVRREAWIYELVAPVAHGTCWQVEIRRAVRDEWRAGGAGPFYVVEGDSPEAALNEARAFIERHG